MILSNLLDVTAAHFKKSIPLFVPAKESADSHFFSRSSATIRVRSTPKLDKACRKVPEPTQGSSHRSLSSSPRECTIASAKARGVVMAQSCKTLGVISLIQLENKVAGGLLHLSVIQDDPIALFKLSIFQANRALSRLF